MDVSIKTVFPILVDDVQTGRAGMKTKVSYILGKFLFFTISFANLKKTSLAK